VGLKNIFVIILTFLCLIPVHSVAEVPAPAQLSNYIVDPEAKLLRSALKAASRRQWQSVENYRQKMTDPTARDILVWIAAMKDPNVSFDNLTYVVRNLNNWPRMTGIQAKAEYKLFDKPIGAQNTLSWFSGIEPISGEGRAALADAHFATGNTTSGDLWLKKAWREAKLTRDRQKSIYKKHKARLTPDDHAARADYLIWEGTAHFSKVDGLMSLMPADQKKVIDARLRLC